MRYLLNLISEIAIFYYFLMYFAPKMIELSWHSNEYFFQASLVSLKSILTKKKSLKIYVLIKLFQKSAFLKNCFDIFYPKKWPIYHDIPISFFILSDLSDMHLNTKQIQEISVTSLFIKYIRNQQLLLIFIYFTPKLTLIYHGIEMIYFFLSSLELLTPI